MYLTVGHRTPQPDASTLLVTSATRKMTKGSRTVQPDSEGWIAGPVRAEYVEGTILVNISDHAIMQTRPIDDLLGPLCSLAVHVVVDRQSTLPGRVHLTNYNIDIAVVVHVRRLERMDTGGGRLNDATGPAL